MCAGGLKRGIHRIESARNTMMKKNRNAPGPQWSLRGGRGVMFMWHLGREGIQSHPTQSYIRAHRSRGFIVPCSAASLWGGGDEEEGSAGVLSLSLSSQTTGKAREGRGGAEGKKGNGGRRRDDDTNTRTGQAAPCPVEEMEAHPANPKAQQMEAHLANGSPSPTNGSITSSRRSGGRRSHSLPLPSPPNKP